MSRTDFLQLARQNRRILARLLYAAATALALVLAYALTFEFQIPRSYLVALPVQVAVLVVLRALAAHAMGVTNGRWRYVGVSDMLRLGGAATLASTGFWILTGFPSVLPPIPTSVVIIELAVFVLGVAATWACYRRCHELLGNGELPRGFSGVRRNVPGDRRQRRIVVVGAGSAGNMLARELRTSGVPARVVAFLDDDPSTHGTRVQDAVVLGSVSGAVSLLAPLGVDEVAIATPSATAGELRCMLEALEPLGLPIKVLPGIREVFEGNVQAGQLRPLVIKDLLARESVTLRLPELREDIAGKTVLVTGAAGSIGSELARHLAANAPGRLILLDQAESDLYWVELELRETYPELLLEPLVADILDLARVREVFATWRPDRVYHAAAYKHVPLMERNPREALRNNVLGTWNVAEAAGRTEAGRFVLVSTDKAADPASVMGATKRAAELAVQRAQAAYPETHYTGVRFGNVLGSNGSVIPLFERQIEKGGPVTITDPEVTRYFMTIPEAAQLVLQAGLLDEGRGQIVMLEMGEAVPIVELARNLVRLRGLRPEVDIPFVFTGLRPGEKMHETLVGELETLRPTRLEGVRILEAPGGTNHEDELDLLLGTATRGGMTGKQARELLDRLMEATRDAEALQMSGTG